VTAKIIPVLKITDALLTSSTLTEPNTDAGDGAAWLVGTTYALGDKVSKNHVNYESLQASNTGNDPEEVGSLFWVAQLATNRWAVFDGSIQDQSSRETSATWVITPSVTTNAVSLFNLGPATDLTIVVTDPTDGEVYNRTFPLVDNSGVIDAYTYFFSPIITVSNICITDIPPYANAAISITVNAPGGTASVGQISLGYFEVIGDTLDEVPISINDFTRLNEDQFGRTTPVIRGYSRTATPAIAVDTFRVTYLERRLADQRGIPTVWAFDTKDRDNELVYLGFYNSYNFLYQYAGKTFLDIDIRSLV